MGYLSACKSHTSVSTSTPSPASTNLHQHHPHLLHFTHEQLASATSNFSDSSLLGRGSHGSVFKASTPATGTFAVKRPSRSPLELLNELRVLSLLPSPPSPLLVPLLGFSPDPPLLALELMPHGSLFDLLHSRSPPPPWPLRLRLALRSARALLFLHSLSPPLIHRDVKSANVLLDRRLRARLADFGLSVFAPDPNSHPVTATPPAGTLGYLDPAYVTPEKLSTKTDVFSFGIMLLEIVSGRKAIDVAHSPPSIVDWALPLVKRGRVLALFDPRIAPPRDARARRDLVLLAARCVRSSRERRPDMAEVVARLEAVKRRVAGRGWNVANPCSAVETVDRMRPLPESEDDGEGSDCADGPRPSGNARRVHSRRSLVELIKGPGEEIVKHRGGGDGGVGTGRTRGVRVIRDERPVRTRRDRPMRSAFETLSLGEEDAADGRMVQTLAPL